MQLLFKELSAKLLAQVEPTESLAISYSGESSQFIRINSAKVRQAGMVEQGFVTLALVSANRRASGSVTMSGQPEADLFLLQQELARLRIEITMLPKDPYIVLPVGDQNSITLKTGVLPDPMTCIDQLIGPMRGMDLTGIWASGRMYRAHANSVGSHHWFESDSFSLDYSLVNSQERMLKATYAGIDWSQADYQAGLESSIQKLKLMDKPGITISPGKYRTYIASAGVSDLLAMFSWHGLSEAEMQTGQSSLNKMRQQKTRLSEKFSLSEDFSSGLVPRFNDMGEVAAVQLPLIEKGRLKNTLVSSRTASEFNLSSNFATDSEGLRAPVMATGNLGEADVLRVLDTGVYLSNLHYLNWSDAAAGRITGMTRYACFWVENGKIQGPIENMRFDDSLYHFFGDKLEAVTAQKKLIPDVGSYGGRTPAVTQCPGILLSSFALTL